MGNIYERQWIRKVGLVVTRPGSPTTDIANPDLGLDLSKFRIKFSVNNADIESPNSAHIRVYNLTPGTIQAIRGEFSGVVLSAGYEQGNYGNIFTGTIKQFRVGRENATDSYLDILAADGDVLYTQGIINASYRAGATPRQLLDDIGNKVPDGGVDYGALTSDKQFYPMPRGSVQFGMARARFRNVVTSLDAGWSIENNTMIVTDNTGYRDGVAVEINVGTGLIGVPQQIDQGIRLQCLLNSRIRIGGRVKLNNNEILQLWQQNPDAAPVAFNTYGGVQSIAPLSQDGMYRAFAVEHDGDTRGSNWYSDIICLAVNESAARNKSVSPE